ncbi:hypothetical protein Vadar_003757 [Vaccinium darrowii]|uniref:Uncharacterized protein n=1 Tax=Vaccinium darrowii TaxID=229202 RepID=A0ACB7Z1P7_9ERIC|nr:hypothetical protein Vadar_003757 [Vaccinium darrowii]
MDNLPREIIVNILSRLPIKPLIRCKSVCKSFLNLTRDPYLINTHLNHASSHNEENPTLILHTTTISYSFNQFRSHLYYATQTPTNSFSCEQIHFISPLNINEFRVLGSCNGLLFLLHPTIDGRVSVINPSTRKLIEIPNLMAGKSSVGMGIGFSPKSNEYKVVKVFDWSALYVYSLSKGIWREVGAPSFKISGDLKSNVCVNGVVHWASDSPSNSIVCFNVADEVFDVIPYPAGGLRQGGFSLAVFSGCLGVIEYEENNCIDIWVMKDYNVRESWTRSFTINLKNQFWWDCKDVQVLCVQKNGEILMRYRNQELWFYDPKNMIFRKPSIFGFPHSFEAVCHVGSLVSPSDEDISKPKSMKTK